MAPGANEDDPARGRDPVVDLVDQEEVPTDLSFAIGLPVAFEGMVTPLGAERPVVGDRKQHEFLQTDQIVTARPRQPVPILQESPGVVDPTRKGRSLTCRGLQGL